MNPIDFARHLLVDLWKLPLFFQFALAWGVVAAVWQWWKRRQQAEMLAASRAWPVYKARVVWAQVSDRKSQGEDGPSFWEGLLTYSYTVPGCELEVGEHRERFDNEEDADTWARGLRDTFVEVRVDPLDARRSLWEATDVRSTAQREAFFFDRSRSATPGFWAVSDLAAWVVFCLSSVGAVLALWIQASLLIGRPTVTAESNSTAFFGMHMGAIVCGIASGAIAQKRSRPSRNWQGSLTRVSPKFPLTKVLSAYVTLVFLYGWVRIGVHEGRNEQWYGLIFSSVWLMCYAGAALACWGHLHQHEPGPS